VGRRCGDVLVDAFDPTGATLDGLVDNPGRIHLLAPGQPFTLTPLSTGHADRLDEKPS
jgi:hypothetical protein